MTFFVRVFVSLNSWYVGGPPTMFLIPSVYKIVTKLVDVVFLLT